MTQIKVISLKQMSEEEFESTVNTFLATHQDASIVTAGHDHDVGWCAIIQYTVKAPAKTMMSEVDWGNVDKALGVSGDYM